MVEDLIKHKAIFKKKSHDNKHLLDFIKKMENNRCFEKQNTYFNKHSFFWNNLQMFFIKNALDNILSNYTKKNWSKF